MENSSIKIPRRKNSKKNFILTPWRFLQMASFMPWQLHLNNNKSILLQFVISVYNMLCLTNKDMEQHDTAIYWW